MNVSAIISEYNPLHNGHLYHISKTKEITSADAVICVMSGNFVQRGLPAIIDKWSRTKMALLNGIDLVVELPVIYSLSSAEFFSYGAVSLLNNIGVVNNICFGSEIGSIQVLMHVASLLLNESNEFKVTIKKYLNKGIAYPVARSLVLQHILKQCDDFKEYSNEEWSSILNSSNNILGIEYCKSLLSLNSNIKPYTIQRKGASYASESLHHEYSSATSIRKTIKISKNIEEIKCHVPETVYSIISEINSYENSFVFEDDILPYIRYKYFSSQSNIKNLPDVSEGIENRIYKGLLQQSNYSALIEYIKSKRYTYSRISRILCQYFIGFEQYNTTLLRKTACPYARVLGFNKTGANILKEAKKTSSIPIYTKLPSTMNEHLSLDIQSTKAYSLLNKRISPVADYLNGPIIIK